MVAVSAKIPAELRRKLRELGIKPAPIIRQALEEAVRKEEIEQLHQELEQIADILAKIPPIGL
jgi:hypothetical protein